MVSMQATRLRRRCLGDSFESIPQLGYWAYNSAISALGQEGFVRFKGILVSAGYAIFVRRKR